eukprot:773405_1
MQDEQKYDDDDGFVTVSFMDEPLETITDNPPIAWHNRTFPSWCPIFHFSPIEDGLSITSIGAARVFKYQWYGTVVSSIFDFLISVILVSTKQRKIDILGSSFLILFGIMALATYTFNIAYRFLVYETTSLQRSA